MNRTVKVGHVLAVGAWTLAVLLMILGTVAAAFGLDWTLPVVLCLNGLLVMGAAATLTVRNLFERQDQLIHDSFVMGQETGGGMRRIR